MSSWSFVVQSLRFYWRTHIGVVLGSMIATAVLVGALLVGDSVRHSLHSMAFQRLGSIHFALYGRDRYFREDLAAEVRAAVTDDESRIVEPMLEIPGIAAAPDHDQRVNRVNVYGVTTKFGALGTQPKSPSLQLEQGEIALNQSLARKLGVAVGDSIVLRVDKPSLLSRDMPLGSETDTSVVLRGKLKQILSAAELGNFSLQANQIPPFNAFVNLDWLQERVELAGRANMIVVNAGDSDTLSADSLNDALNNLWRLEDADLQLRELPEQQAVELRTGRIFFDPPVAEVALSLRDQIQTTGVLTYFVNELRFGDKATPYSMVASLALLTDKESVPDDSTGITINDWLAEDLGAQVGDTLKVKYFVIGKNRQLEEASTDMTVRAIKPIEGVMADRELMPAFPGIADSENCRDWEPGIPVDLEKIRDKDEDYWDKYKGTPKGLIDLQLGQQLWRNRFGELTAIRFAAGEGVQDKVRQTLKQNLEPRTISLFFQDVHAPALAASTQALDFGQLFLGFSFFLIVAALILTSLLFVFGIEKRSQEVGLLLAVGLTPGQTKRLLLVEGAILATIGSLVGTGLGVFYTKGVLWGLSTVWRSAVQTAAITFHANPGTYVNGAVSGIVVAMLSMWFVLRKQGRQPARVLLAGMDAATLHTPSEKRKRSWAFIVGVICFVSAIAMVTGSQSGQAAAGLFFGAGAMLLIGGISFSRTLLAKLDADAESKLLSISAVGVRNASRRWGRSLATVGLLACGSFLVVAVGANRQDPLRDAHLRSSGTGGFALFGESTLPITQDLNSPEGREFHAIDDEELAGVSFLPLRVRDGDEASCLNLNRAQKPRLMAVDGAKLADLKAFTFAASAGDDPSASAWTLLDTVASEDSDELPVIPAIGDQAVVMWALGKSLNDSLTYTDERGQKFKLKIVGLLSKSILQGCLLISENHFIQRFPSESGYRAFLIDAARDDQLASVTKELARAFEDVGMSLTDTVDRLAAFNSVEETYLSIFLVLGGLGLLLGSIGLAMVVIRNVLERRSELALLRAIGYDVAQLRKLLLSEHGLLLALGLGCGVVAAIVAVLPALTSPGAKIPTGSIVITVCAVVLSGLLWVYLASLWALRGPLLASLRDES